jgi:hypothetical protein
MAPILIPTRSADDWKQFLADERHWRTGYSARSLAQCWHAAAGLPPEIQAVLHSTPLFAQAELLLAIPEHRVALPGSGRPSQTDLWLLLRTPAALASVAVEGKVAEPFGPTIGEWLGDGGEAANPNKSRRLKGLCELLGLASAAPELRYQLLHRTASAVIEARRFLAAHAVMLVHSFSQQDAWYDDFERFARALDAEPAKGKLTVVPGRTGPTLHLGWVRGDAAHLSS